MDFRDWLIVVGVVIILGILIDGYRRMRLAKMDSLKMSRDMGGDIEPSALEEVINPELPGGARIVSRGSDSAENSNNDSDDETYRKEPSLGPSTNSSVSDDLSEVLTPENSGLNANADDRIDPQTVAPAKPVEEESAISLKESSHEKESLEKKQNANVAAASTKHDSAREEQEVIVINVDAKTEKEFVGAEVKRLLEACGLEHGEMSIFHRHEEDDLLSPIQFSVANAVEPGYFDPQTLDTVSTPGVSFFLSLPGPKDYMKAFEFMLETAQCFATNLNGELRDEHRSVITSQTIEHCRQRVREFERKRLSKIKQKH